MPSVVLRPAAWRSGGASMPEPDLAAGQPATRRAGRRRRHPELGPGGGGARRGLARRSAAWRRTLVRAAASLDGPAAGAARTAGSATCHLALRSAGRAAPRRRAACEAPCTRAGRAPRRHVGRSARHGPAARHGLSLTPAAPAPSAARRSKGSSPCLRHAGCAASITAEPRAALGALLSARMHHLVKLSYTSIIAGPIRTIKKSW